MKRHLSNALLSVLCLWTACDDSNAVNPDAGSSDVAETDADTPDALETRGPLELSANLCEDPANMDVLLASPTFNAIRSDGGFNTEQLERMIAAPSEGPFYMFNLIRFREQAVYADGRETERTGREANALYSPIEFLTAIGARIVFNTDVDEKVDGDDDVVWESIAIVEYPCPIAFFAMATNPAFMERLEHKDAAVETTFIMVTELQDSPLPDGFEPPESSYTTDEDPVFEIVHVHDFHEIAQYEDDVDEPERSGQAAFDLYTAAGNEVSTEVGVWPTARFVVQGVLAGDDRSWDEVRILRMPSRAGFQVVLDDETRRAATYHRTASIAHNYSLITYPSINAIPGAPGGEGGLEVTEDGTGALCSTDDDCPGGGVDTCLLATGSTGFCTREGCGAGECQGSYTCCRECADFVAPMLPFEGSACLPATAAEQLSAAPASCTCD